jgi:hypothetical protein
LFELRDCRFAQGFNPGCERVDDLLNLGGTPLGSFRCVGVAVDRVADFAAEAIR